jgi:putative ABC transport system permease protein
MLLNDMQYAVRMLRKTPVFTAAAVLTLALGIGANTAIFSVVNAVMLRPLPFAKPDRLVRIFEKNDRLHLSQFSSSVLNYVSWKEQSQSFDSLAAVGFASFNLTGSGDPEQFSGSTITPSLFPLLGIHPLIGRDFREDEDKPGSPPVVMISEGLWKRRFGADPSVIGKTVMLNGLDYTLVGIAPPALAVLTTGDIWVPLTIDPGRENRLNHVTVALGRLKPGVTLQQAQSEMDTVSGRLALEYPEMKGWGTQLIDFYHWFVPEPLRAALLALLGAVALVLLIAAANVANLLLSRAAARQKEIAVRTALGASQSRLLRQFLTESLLLAFLGGGAGLLAATWIVRGMAAALPPNLLPISDVSIDSTVLLFALGVTLSTGILFGMAPSWHALKTNLTLLLNTAGRSSTPAARPTVRNWLVGGELALATVLLIGAGLLIQSLQRLRQVPLGFQPEGLLTFQLSLPPAKYQGTSQGWAFYKAMLESLRTLPGVSGAAISSGVPLGAGNYTTTPANTIGKSPLPTDTAVPIDWRVVSPGFFGTMKIPLLRGRYFDERDGADTPAVTVVSQETAKKLWGDDDPIGRQVHIVASGKNFTVVGVVGDVRNTTLNQQPSGEMYYPASTRLWPLMDVVVRTQGNPVAALPAVRERIHELDPELPLSTVRTMQEWVSTNAAQPRLNTILLAVFAGVALLIATIGIYGVLAYSVNQRTTEIGLRMALGAQQADVQRLIVWEGMTVSLIGIGVGLAGAFALSRVLASLLFEVRVHDPATFLAIPLALATVALAACYVPARRASRVDPMVALRCE